MPGSDDGVPGSPPRTPTGSVSPARIARDAQLCQDFLDSQNESLARAIASARAQLDADSDVRQTAFEAGQLESMQLEHLTNMEELRAWLMSINSNADAQPLPSSHPTYSGDEPSVAKTLSNIYGPKHVSNFARNNQ